MQPAAVQGCGQARYGCTFVVEELRIAALARLSSALFSGCVSPLPCFCAPMLQA